MQQQPDLVPVDAEPFLLQQIPVVLVQVASRILLSKDDYSSSGDNAGLDSFVHSTLTLLALEPLPFMNTLAPDIGQLIEARRQKLEEILDGRHLSSTLKAYALTMMRKIDLERSTFILQPRPDRQDSTRKLEYFTEFFRSADYMKGESLISIKASVLEGSFYTSLLKLVRSNTFFIAPAHGKDKYIEYIPPMFTRQSTFFERCIPPQWLYDIMLWSMFVFLIDEYMESVVADFSFVELTILKHELEKFHLTPEPRASIVKSPHLPCTEFPDGTLLTSPFSTTRVQAAFRTFYD